MAIFTNPKVNYPLTDDGFSNAMYEKYGDGAQVDYLDASANIRKIQDILEQLIMEMKIPGVVSVPNWQYGKYDRYTMRALGQYAFTHGFPDAVVMSDAIYAALEGQAVVAPPPAREGSKLVTYVGAIAGAYVAYRILGRLLGKRSKRRAW